ncbi:uncharacterized protein CCR75_004308 [Bremia lactucae]|uniref:B box-type domain-containing protein n=1 Tax=Bremia lactucae TaxID=4779 RepID=A0A976NYT9_BRELC|nr:hypothetical protein CCR75_004308 [Bremia lactucae]
MDGRAPVSVVAGATGEVLVVSPPPINLDSLEPMPKGSNSIVGPSTDPTQPHPAAQSATKDSLLCASSARPAPIKQDKQQLCQEIELSKFIEVDRLSRDAATHSLEREKGGYQFKVDGSRDNQSEATAYIDAIQSARKGALMQQTHDVGAVAASERLKKKIKWFDILPVLLQNFKTQNQEQIRHLMLPRCELCERGKVDRKAEVKCNQDGCKMKDQVMCLTCWRSSHSVECLRTHPQVLASDRIAYWCAECDLQFCSKCFDLIHSVVMVKCHRKLATEGLLAVETNAPGPCVAKSHWSVNFQKVIRQMVAVQRHSHQATKGFPGPGAGRKLKRSVEVIVIDDDEADDNDDLTCVQSNVSLSHENFGQQVGNEALKFYESKTQSQGNSARYKKAFTSFRQNLAQPQSIQQAAHLLSHDSAAHFSNIEPISFSQKPTGTTLLPSTLPKSVPIGLTHSATSTGVNTFYIHSSVATSQSNICAPQFESVSLMANGNSTIFAPIGMSNEGMQALPMFTGSTDSTVNEVCPEMPRINTSFPCSANLRSFVPLGGAVFAENVLIDSLLDRYHETNQIVTNMELQHEQLTRQIAITTCQGPYMAGPIMDLLNNLQPMLEKARLRRSKLFIAMVIQSSKIMESVRLLHKSDLGDVPQVSNISHRKCLRISEEIDQHKQKLVELNYYLSESLNQCQAISSSWESKVIQTTSAEIQMLEASIKELERIREVEILRIVQYSKKVRDELKKEFQRTLNMRLQQTR